MFYSKCHPLTSQNTKHPYIIENNAEKYHCVMNHAVMSIHFVWVHPFTRLTHTSFVHDRLRPPTSTSRNRTTIAKGHILIKFLQNNRMASLRVTFWIKPWFPLRQFPYMKSYWKMFNIKAQPLFTVSSETGSCTICQTRKVFSFNDALICFRFAACQSYYINISTTITKIKSYS